jgi:hypothetical protein
MYGDQIIPWNHIDLDNNDVYDNFGENLRISIVFYTTTKYVVVLCLNESVVAIVVIDL